MRIFTSLILSPFFVLLVGCGPTASNLSEDDTGDEKKITPEQQIRNELLQRSITDIGWVVRTRSSQQSMAFYQAVYAILDENKEGSIRPEDRLAVILREMAPPLVRFSNSFEGILSEVKNNRKIAISNSVAGVIHSPLWSKLSIVLNQYEVADTVTELDKKNLERALSENRSAAKSLMNTTKLLKLEYKTVNQDEVLASGDREVQQR